MHRWKRMAVFAMLIGTPGCMRWRHVPLPTPEEPPNVVSNLTRVRLKTGQSVNFLTLVVDRDSIFGIRNNLARTRMSISFDQVNRIEVREKDALKTLGLLAVVAGAIYWSGAAGVGPNR